MKLGFLNHEDIEKAVIKAGELGLEPFMYCNTKVKTAVEKRKRRRRSRSNLNRSSSRMKRTQ